MSLAKAFDLIRSELPETVARAVISALESIGGAEELTVSDFSMWRMKNPSNVRSVCEHRLIGCETATKEAWLKEQIAFMDDSSAAGTSRELWQAYCTTQLDRVSFLVDALREKFCRGPFP